MTFSVQLDLVQRTDRCVVHTSFLAISGIEGGGVLLYKEEIIYINTVI